MNKLNLNLKYKECNKRALIKKQLMAEEFQYDLQLAQMQMQATKSKEAEVEDRKDKRTKIQATQQSKMIESKTK